MDETMALTGKHLIIPPGLRAPGHEGYVWAKYGYADLSPEDWEKISKLTVEVVSDYREIAQTARRSSHVPDEFVEQILKSGNDQVKKLVCQLNGGPLQIANDLLDTTVVVDGDPENVAVCQLCEQHGIFDPGCSFQTSEVFFHGETSARGSCSYMVCGPCFIGMVSAFYESDDPGVTIRCPHCRENIKERYFARVTAFSKENFRVEDGKVVDKKRKREPRAEDEEPSKRQRPLPTVIDLDDNE